MLTKLSAQRAEANTEKIIEILQPSGKTAAEVEIHIQLLRLSSMNLKKSGRVSADATKKETKVLHLLRVLADQEMQLCAATPTRKQSQLISKIDKTRASINEIMAALDGMELDPTWDVRREELRKNVEAGISSQAPHNSAPSDPLEAIPRHPLDARRLPNMFENNFINTGTGRPNFGHAEARTGETRTKYT